MAEGFARVFTAMIEPVKGCNLGCRYCYSDTENGGVMSHEVLSPALEKIIRYTEQTGFSEIHFVWHGGEPLLAGIDFFRYAVTVLKKLASRVSCRHFIQTNGLLLDDEFCRFFREMNFEVGVSLDGPQELHDQFRVQRNGSGTHSAVMEKVGLLEKHQVPVGFNAVVSQATRGHERKIYQFFQGIGYGFRVNPLLPAWNHDKTEKYLLCEGEYGRILRRLFDEWTLSETQRVRVSPLDVYLHAVLEGETNECQQRSTCIGTHLGIKPGGKAVICSRFENHLLGDIREMSIAALFCSPVCRQVQMRTDALVECHSCVNWSICYGGCPHNTIAFGRSLMERDPFCKDYKIIFDHIRSTLRRYGDADVKNKTQ